MNASSPADVWAVGWWSAGNRFQPLIEHWDGTSWQFMDVPTNPKKDIVLTGVSALSPSEVWAVGYRNVNRLRTVAYRWDGTSWQTVPTVDPGSIYNELFSVKAFASDDVWAVGAFYSQMPSTLVEHWDGTRWRAVPTPRPGGTMDFQGVDGAATSDLWAAGTFTPSGSYGARSLAERWDGSAWTRVRAPSPSRYGAVVLGLSVDASDDAWIVGSADRGKRTFTARWDGRVRGTVPSPSQGTSINTLEAVSASSPANAWAVGSYGLASTLTLRWDGAAWSIVPSPNLGGSYLHGVVSVSDTEAYAVGVGDDDGVITPLVEHFC